MPSSIPFLVRRVAVVAAAVVSAVAFAQGAAQVGGTAGARVPFDAAVAGVVTLQGGAPVANARVTLFRPDLSFFRELRTQPDGTYAMPFVPTGPLQLGVAAVGLEYQEVPLNLAPGTSQRDFVLTPETNAGQWTVIGNTLPEVLDATDIGVLRPDGTIFYCHDTTDPIVFDPRTGQKSFPLSSGSPQGCMNASLLADGSVILVGGQAGSNPGDFVNGIPWVKRFWPNDTWSLLTSVNQSAGRWYPGLARLNDGSLIVIGGAMAPDATRSDTCELLDLTTLTWDWTGDVGNPVEFPPSALLHTGDVLHTWAGRPQLYDAASGSWSDTGQFVFPNRGYPGHSDHSLLVLSDGRALIVGASRAGQPAAAMSEYYDPGTGQWSVGSSPGLVRMQPEVVYLPDGRIFVGAGDQESTGGSEPNVLGIVRRCDQFDPVSGQWRRVADMANYREYHAVTLLLPDGRIATTGGTYIKFQFGPTSADIEAWSPPYLFRGVRPQLSKPTTTTPVRGETLAFQVWPATQLTSVVLMGLQSTTHWVDCGIPRRLELPVVQVGFQAAVTLPTDPDLLPLGWYMLFGMVDDIPSEAIVLRVDP